MKRFLGPGLSVPVVGETGIRRPRHADIGTRKVCAQSVRSGKESAIKPDISGALEWLEPDSYQDSANQPHLL